MAYFSFNKITPPAPDDPNVDEVTQLNENWDTIDLKIDPYINGGTISDIEIGQEFPNANFDFCVQGSGGTVIPDDISEGWSAWTNIPLLSPRSSPVGLTPKWRNNSLLRMVELTGAVTFNVAADPWTLGSSFLVNGDVVGSPPGSMQPIGNLHYSPAAAGLPADPAITAGGFITIEQPGGSTYTRIRAQYLGGPGGGNFISLDQVWWWY